MWFPIAATAGLWASIINRFWSHPAHIPYQVEILNPYQHPYQTSGWWWISTSRLMSTFSQIIRIHLNSYPSIFYMPHLHPYHVLCSHFKHIVVIHSQVNPYQHPNTVQTHSNHYPHPSQPQSTFTLTSTDRHSEAPSVIFTSPSIKGSGPGHAI